MAKQEVPLQSFFAQKMHQLKSFNPLHMIKVGYPTYVMDWKFFQLAMQEETKKFYSPQQEVLKQPAH